MYCRIIFPTAIDLFQKIKNKLTQEHGVFLSVSAINPFEWAIKHRTVPIIRSPSGRSPTSISHFR